MWRWLPDSRAWLRDLCSLVSPFCTCCPQICVSSTLKLGRGAAEVPLGPVGDEPTSYSLSGRGLGAALHCPHRAAVAPGLLSVPHRRSRSKSDDCRAPVPSSPLGPWPPPWASWCPAAWAPQFLTLCSPVCCQVVGWPAARPWFGDGCSTRPSQMWVQILPLCFLAVRLSFRASVSLFVKGGF